jgi:NTE family protein
MIAVLFAAGMEWRRIGHLRFEDLRVPCAVVASDLTACAKFVFDRGPIEPAVRATCAAPEFYRPVVHDGHLPVDGGLVEPLPVETALALSAAAPRPCVAVSVQCPLLLSDSPRNPLQLLGRISDIVQQELRRRRHARKTGPSAGNPSGSGALLPT